MGVSPATVEHAIDASAIVSVDGDGRVVDLNATAAELLGTTPERARAQPFAELGVPSDLRELFWSSLLGVVSGRIALGEPAFFRTRIEGEGGQEVCVYAAVIRTAEDPLRLTAYAMPVPDDQMNFERAERLLDIQLRVASIAGWERDLLTDEVTNTPGQLDLFGLLDGKPNEVISADDIPFVTEDERARFAALQDEVAADPARFVGVLQRFNVRVHVPDGTIRALLVSFEIQRDHTGAPHWFTGAVQDVSATRSTEQEIEALHAVRRVIVEWDDENGFRELIAALGTALEAAVAVLWTEREEPGQLWCRHFWSAADFDGADLEVAYRRLPIEKGVGASGRAFATGQAQHEAPQPESPYGPAAREAGLRRVVGFPATYGGDVLAVVVIGWTDDRWISRRLLTSFDTIGGAVGRFLHTRRGELGDQPLTARELQVLRLAATGQAGPEIAERLAISPATVKTHFGNVYDKLGAADRAAAVAEAFRLGLLT